ncbi:type IV toxin-antitoxin system AbiEi family antitoxin domain-containing protein [Raineyella fluvialis]|uniref:Transcriptional regulator, AbiEi antitoxin, Type IV TA system n=1 Tax=Raineyella fluvialis TaxID=2662261 RepID=A0A5Q2FCY8_9ACTN|nr:type IV toxin-antitoxin system AbiEi family antitoxin domain-containing protein [Raineyella fluvialis]QGF23637.1 hypothetical protein Rai3103_08090 [Raineyella fluvialis]
MERPEFSLPLVRTRQSILDAGLDDNHIRRALASGEMVRIRRGCYTDRVQVGEKTNQPKGKEAEQASIGVGARVAAVAARWGEEAVFSHATAAELWGLPFLGDPPGTTHVTVPRVAHGARRATVHQHPGLLLPEEIVALNGIRVTTLPRTLVDVARTEGFRAGVVMADHALRETRDRAGLRRGMLASITRLKGAVGIGEARRMLSFAVGEAESPGETLCRVIFSEQLVPAPQLQYRLVLGTRDGGPREYRTDFAWERQKVVGEFDGKMKYERYARRGETPGDVVFREKRREEVIRAAGWTVVRWIWRDLDRPRELGQQLRELLAARG